jgi:hypothetical protein
VPLEEYEILTMEAPHEATKAKETKEVSLGLIDLSKTMKIEAHLDPN